ncbi:MAG: hypothetical protein KA010_04620, partial [Saprospiraceae bacterium]|nr:hypothetical protein [Saprospiraceae bacterium]
MKTITYQLIKLIVFAVVSLSTYIDTNAQQFDFVPTDNLSRNSSTFRDNLNSFKSYTVPTLEIKNYLASSSNQLEISFRLGSDLTLQLELQKDETLVSGMSVNVGTDHGTVPFELNTANILTYYGYVKGDYASMVRLTFTDNMVFGIIKNGNDDNFTYIEPDFQADNSNGVVHAMYKSSDVKDGSRFSCNAVETEELLDNVVEDQHNRTIESNERAGLCYVAELAIANDYSMLTRYSTVANVVSRNVALMNNVQGLYLNNFDDDINFKIVNQFVATSNAADPVATTYTLASDILSQFKTWGNAGGFGSGVTYDLAQFWSTRSMGGPVGLAYVGSSVICGTSRYHILSDFSTISQVITVATAHEIGHNFNASHDASGSSFIMAPVSTITTTWSPTSLATISTTIVAKGTSGCFHQCYLEGAPISNFTSSYSDICLGGNVTYVSSSFNGPSSYSWTFDGGSPSSSSIKNPSITYNSLGFYDATLTASNITGTGNTLTKSKHVGVFESPTPICIPSNPSSATGGITSFSLGTIVSNTSNSAVSGGYENYICTRTTRLSPSTPYTFSITVGNSASSIFEKIRIYIDYNNDGDFGDSGELAFTTNTTGYIGTVSNLSFTTPASPTKNQLLMMRVIADNSSATTPCPTLGSGQVEDYAVVFYDASQQVLPPIAYESQAGTLNTVASNVNTNTWYKIMSNGYILAEVNPQSNQLGNVTLRLDDCTFVPTDPNGNFFIPRVFNFDCDGPDCVGGNFPNGNVKVRLYFYQNELTDLNTAGGTNLIPSQLNILYY